MNLREKLGTKQKKTIYVKAINKILQRQMKNDSYD